MCDRATQQQRQLDIRYASMAGSSNYHVHMSPVKIYFHVEKCQKWGNVEDEKVKKNWTSDINCFATGTPVAHQPVSDNSIIP